MSYSVTKRQFECGKWISAPEDYLLTSESIKSIDGAQWIWNVFYSRFFIRKYFTLERVGQAYARFYCDNIFDLYINGKLVSFEQKEFEGDVTEYLTEGENRINIRAYQSSEDRFFSSAICGELLCGDVRVVTDGSWETYVGVSFWENTEPENWQTVENPIMKHDAVTCHIHPRLNKRSVCIRKSFTVDKDVRSAILYVTEKGESESYVNGKRTDDGFLPQGINHKYHEYRIHDVTSLLHRGENVMGAITYNGWLNSHSHSCIYMKRNEFLAELVISYTDGSVDTVGTDESWKCRFSPITDNDIQLGERYDAAYEDALEGCFDIGFDDIGWVNVYSSGNSNSDKPFTLKNYPPIRVIRRLLPIKTELAHGGIFLTYAENCAGRCRLEMTGLNRGQKVKVTYYERLRENGDPMVGAYTPVFYNRDGWKGGKALGSNSNIDVYYARGYGEEVFEPRTTFTGFRYMLIEGISPDQLKNAYFNVMHNDLPVTGELSSSYSFINDLYDATRRTWRANIFNGPMDCPTREKNYWTGDTQLFCSTACYLEDSLQFLGRWTDGGSKMCPQVYGWGDEIYVIPYTLYRFYGDEGILRTRYPDILEYARVRIKTEADGLPFDPPSPFNDWLSPERINVDKTFFASAHYCYMLRLVSEIAGIVGDEETKREFSDRYAVSTKAFHERYYNEKERNYNPPNQAGIVFPLALDVVPEEVKADLAQRLNELVLQRGALDTGFGGTRYLMPTLTDYGYNDAAFLLLDRPQFPSWKNMLSYGSGTICESWKGASDMLDEESLSMNHFTLGAVTGWMFEALGGIRYRENEPGFTHVTLKPSFIRQIGDFKCHLDTVNGRIKSEWKYEGDTVIYRFSAERPITLILPDGSSSEYPAGEHTVTY